MNIKYQFFGKYYYHTDYLEMIGFLFVLIPIICMVMVEITNYNKQKRYTDLLKSIREQSNQKNIERDHELTKKYSIFIEKHIVNDNIFYLFKSYYPDGIITSDRIELMLKKYIYNIFDKDKYIFLRCVRNSTRNAKSISDSIIYVYRTINKLIKKMENTYILSNCPTSDTSNKINDFTDFTGNVYYKTSLCVINEYIGNIRFNIMMRKNGYIYINISHSVKLWIPENYNITEKSINLCLIDCDHICKGLKVLDSKQKNIFVEINGLTNFRSLYDMITSDKYNNYDDVDKIGKDFGKIFDMFNNSKFDLYARNYGTIFIIHIIKYHSESINKIYVEDPIFYPYSYFISFNNIRSNKNIQLKYNHNLIRCLHTLSVFGLYFDKNICDKCYNMIYSEKVNVSFSEDSDRYCNKTLIEMMLFMHSKVTMSGVVPCVF